MTACPRRGRSWPCHPPWPPTAVALAVVGSSRERPGHPDRVRLRCPKSFAPSDCSGRTSWWGTSGRTLGYVLVVRPVITGTSAASCHNLPGTKAIRGAHFRLGHRAPGRGGRQARTVSGCLNSAFLGLFSTSCGPSFLAMDTQLGAAGRRTPTIYRSSAQPTIFAGSWFGQALLTSPDPPHPLRPPVSQSPTGGAPPGDPRRTKQIRNDSSRDQRAVKTNFAACHSPATIECARQALKTTEMAKQSMGGPRRWKSSWNTVLSEITNRRPSV